MKVILQGEDVKKVQQRDALQEAFETLREKYENEDFETPQEREECFRELICLGTELQRREAFSLPEIRSLNYEEWEEVSCSHCGAKYPKKYKRCPCCSKKKF